MCQPDGRCPHGDATALFLGIAVEIAERSGETLADYTIGFDEIVCECRLAVIDVRDDCDETGRLWRW